MRTVTYILVSFASLAVIIMVVSHFVSKAGTENEKKQLRELDGISAQVNLLAALAEAYKLNLNIDSISTAAYAVPGNKRTEKIGELARFNDSIRTAHRKVSY